MKKIFFLIIFILNFTGIFAQSFQELPDSLDINLSRFPIEKVFVQNINNNNKINLKEGQYTINRLIGKIKQNDKFSVNEIGLINGETIFIRGSVKKITQVRNSEIYQTEVFTDEILSNKQLFESFKDSILISQIFDRNNKIRTKVQRYFTKKDSLKTITTNFNEEGTKTEFIDEINKNKIFYDNNGKIIKSQVQIDGQPVEKNFENEKLRLLTKGVYPYFHIEQYDVLGNLEILKTLEKNNSIMKYYKNGILINKEYSEDGKNIVEKYQNGKMVEKQISFFEDEIKYIQTFKDGKLVKTEQQKIKEKKNYR